MDHLTYLKSLKLEDWSIIVTSKWTVKDVLAHLVGWEREVALSFMDNWKTKALKYWAGSIIGVVLLLISIGYFTCRG